MNKLAWQAHHGFINDEISRIEKIINFTPTKGTIETIVENPNAEVLYPPL